MYLSRCQWPRWITKLYAVSSDTSPITKIDSFSTMQNGISLLRIYGAFKLLTGRHRSNFTDNCLLSQHRPLDEQLEPVNMADFIDHQRTHNFPFPHCFCPAQYGTNEDVQSAIFVAPDEIYERRYIAACSRRSCEYIGGCVNLYGLI